MSRHLILSAAIVAASFTSSQAADQLVLEPVEPNWKISIGAMYLKRNGANDGELFRDGGPPTGTTTIASANDLGDTGTFGVDVSANGQILGTNIEVRGMWTKPDETDWSVSARQAINSSGFSVGSEDPFGYGLFGANGIFALDAERETTFMSLEANAQVGSLGAAEFLVGVRGIWSNDDLYLEVNSAPSSAPGFFSDVDVDISNRMVGPQVGVRGSFSNLSNSAFELEGFAKLGYLMRHTESKVDTDSNVTGGVSHSDENSRWITMAEIGVVGTIHVTSNMDIELGYQALYLNDLGSSVATLNNSVVNTSNPTRSEIGTESVLFHAAKVAAVWKF